MEIEPVNPNRKLSKKNKKQLSELGSTATAHFPLEIQPDRTERFERLQQAEESKPNVVDDSAL
jgi:hypothetical protein